MRALWILGLTVSVWATGPVIPDTVKEHIRQRVAAEQLVSVQVGVITKDGRDTFVHGAVAKGGAAATMDTRYEIGSITKTFTTLVLAMAVTEGKLKLDDPVSQFVPVDIASFEGAAMQLGHLADHTSALPRLPDNMPYGDINDPYVDYDDARMFDFLKRFKPQRAYGSQYAYSNYGSGLLGRLLARLYDKPFEQLLRDKILDPLKMNHTSITLSDPALLATPYSEGGAVKPWRFQSLAGAGALRSNVPDMLNYLAAQLGITNTSFDDAMALTHQPRVDVRENIQIGLGWHMRDGVLSHGGGTGGFRTFAGFNPKTGMGVVVLTNETVDIQDIGLHILNPEHALPEIKIGFQPSDAAIDAIVGYYELAPGTLFHITRQGKAVFGRLSGQPRLGLKPDSDRVWRNDAVAAIIRFEADADGKIHQLKLEQGGVTQTAKRLPDDYQPPAPPEEIEVSREALAEYVGEYEMGFGQKFDVRLTDNGLEVMLTGQTFFPIFAKDKDVFFYKVVPAEIHFHRDDSGAVEKLVLHQSGRQIPAKRK